MVLSLLVKLVVELGVSSLKFPASPLVILATLVGRVEGELRSLPLGAELMHVDILTVDLIRETVSCVGQSVFSASALFQDLPQADVIFLGYLFCSASVAMIREGIYFVRVGSFSSHLDVEGRRSLRSGEVCLGMVLV